jgi:hypothetical integral membrane protein (TIGR02206 family)
LFKAIFSDNGTFITYGTEHFVSILLWIIFGIIFILYSQKYLSPKQQKKSVVIFCVLIALSQLSKVIIKTQLGVFDHREDLPLHLCNMLPFIIPVSLYFKNRKLWAVLFLWIMAGTFQSLITPTLKESFPHYEFMRYWIVHCGLVIVAIYPIFVWKFRLQLKDLVIGAIAMNVLALFMYFINLGLDANYMYLVAKPSGDTLYSLLGPWPWYILSLEFVMAALFFIVYLPFLFEKKLKKINL